MSKEDEKTASNDALLQASRVLKEWTDHHSEMDDGYGISFDAPSRWRKEISDAYKSGDIEEMGSAALPDVQLQMTRLAFSKDHRVSLNACQFLLGQKGYGAVQRVEHSGDYGKLPTDQLMAILQSKLSNLAKLNPNFDASKLLESGNVEVVNEMDKVDISAEYESIEVKDGEE